MPTITSAKTACEILEFLKDWKKSLSFWEQIHSVIRCNIRFFKKERKRSPRIQIFLLIHAGVDDTIQAEIQNSFWKFLRVFTFGHLNFFCILARIEPTIFGSIRKYVYALCTLTSEKMFHFCNLQRRCIIFVEFDF